MQIVRIIIAVTIAVTLIGCTPSRSGSVYTHEQARRVQQIETGIIVGVRNVQIEGERGVGTLGGAAIGGIAGSSVGGGRGQAIMTVAGGILGGIIGAATEEGITRKNALQITVKLDSGRTVAVVQEADVDYGVGDRIHLLTDGYETRVSR
ncbi:MAG: hypothetical protein BWK79_03490 [Beggiatoa sp. IS2]|nr:MAG: hypothetical protein BWK79_03490 [Beggiatoa sp. IS2]